MVFVPYIYVYSAESTFQVNLAVTGTSTPVVPPTVPTTTVSASNSGSLGSILNIYNVSTVNSSNSSIVSFTTNQPTQAKVFWGKTSDYETGSISGLFYSYDHSIKIDGLDPDTKYFFRIEVVNGRGTTASLESSFQSQKNLVNVPPANVTHFQAIPQEDSIALLWNIPKDTDIASVRVVKSNRFFPRDIYDGEVIFEGNAEKYLDRAVIKDTKYYYAVFGRDSKGNYSSGALAQARISDNPKLVISSTSTIPLFDISVIGTNDPIINDLTLSDFDFIQSGRRIVNVGTVIAVDGSENLTINLDYDKVPEILKTIAITLSDPDDSSKTFLFLLRVNKDKTAYEATIAPLGKNGKYGINIMILDYKNQGLKKIEGSLRALVLASGISALDGCGVFVALDSCSELLMNYKLLLYVLILVLIAITYFILRRNKIRENSEKMNEA